MKKYNLSSKLGLSLIIFNLFSVSTFAQTNLDIMSDIFTQTYFEEKYFDDLSKVLFEYNVSNNLNNNLTYSSYSIQSNTRNNLPEEILENTSYTELIKANPLFEYAFNQLDKPYVYAKSGPESFDCSGFTYYVYKQAGITIPRTSDEQSKKGTEVDMDSLKPGDLVFFDTRSVKNNSDITDAYQDSEQYIDILLQTEVSSTISQATEKNSFTPEKVTHVGMYIGDNKFIHASSGGKKVIISDLATGYYKTRYLLAKRYL